MKKRWQLDAKVARRQFGREKNFSIGRHDPRLGPHLPDGRITDCVICALTVGFSILDQCFEPRRVQVAPHPSQQMT